jgi:hypothetical protein
MGRLEVRIYHGSGAGDLPAFILVLAIAGLAWAIEIIASMLWWIVGITAVVTIAGAITVALLLRMTRRREARFAAVLAARRATTAIPVQRARELPPAAHYHLHIHSGHQAPVTTSSYRDELTT